MCRRERDTILVLPARSTGRVKNARSLSRIKLTLKRLKLARRLMRTTLKMIRVVQALKVICLPEVSSVLRASSQTGISLLSKMCQMMSSTQLRDLWKTASTNSTLMK